MTRVRTSLSLRGIQGIFSSQPEMFESDGTLLQNDLPASYVMDAVKGPLVIRRVVSGDGSSAGKKEVWEMRRPPG